MAFHPMRTFQKNRKFWMATILLVCMVTFVLCTGFQGGDFGDWLLRILGKRQGYEVTQINGRAVYSQDLHDLKIRRDLANAYMREAVQLVTLELKDRLDKAGKITSDKERAKVLHELTAMQRLMADKLARQRYFRGGTKLDDLLDFLIWRGQADRLNIRLTADAVKDLIARELLSSNEHYRQYTRWGSTSSAYVQRQVLSNYHGASYRTLVDALTDEFRVHIAQLMLEAASAPLGVQRAPGSGGTPSAEDSLETRMAPTPEQIYEYYRKNRNEAEIALIPIRVERLLNDPAIPKPTEDELERFFKRHKDRKYDPADKEPGFQQPERARVRWLTADPKSKFYTEAARAATTLQITPPLLQPVQKGKPFQVFAAATKLTPPFLDQPGVSLPLAAASYAARSAAWEASLARNFQNLKNRPATRERYLMASRATPYFALPLFKGVEEPKPADVAALVAATAESTFGPAAVAGFQAAAYFPQAEELAPVLEYERKKRAPLGATIVLTAPAMPLAAAAMNAYAARPQFLPLVGSVKKEMRDRIEANLAEEWAKETMHIVRERLEANKGKHTLTSELRKLQKSGPRFRAGLQEGGTSGLRSPFDIGDDPGMAPLRKAFERYYEDINIKEGRGGTASQLRADDFDRMFFGAESFGVGSLLEFDPKPWPPAVTVKPSQLETLVKGRNLRLETIQLFDRAEQPFLFWREEVKPPHTPENLSEVRDAVERAWRLEKARALIGPKVQAVADELLKSEKSPDSDLWLAVRNAARGQKEPLIVLRKVAPLVEQTLGGEMMGTVVVYEDYKLPRGKIQYPREDTPKKILALRDPKEPVKVGIPEIDKLNKTLFEATKDTGKVIQVLANKPQTVFYVAAVVRPSQASPLGFMDAYRMAGGIPARNLFVERCQAEYAREYRERLMEQLRRDAKMTEVSAEARKEFAGEGANK